MDPLCHTLVGTTLAQTGLKHRTPLATAALVIGANLPDVDALTYFVGESLLIRRGWTHGVAALAIWPFVLTALLLGWDRLSRSSPRDLGARAPAKASALLWLSAVAVLSHTTLDFMNNYGVRWLKPLSNRWYYGDALFIADPWIWAALALGTLVSWQLGRRTPRRRRWWLTARVAVAAVVVYAAGMLAVGHASRPFVRDLLAARGVVVVRPPMVAPILANPLTRYVVADDGTNYHVVEYRWWPRPALGAARVIPRGDTHPAVEAARGHPDARGFLQWTRFPFFEVRETADATVVTMDDARYAPPLGRSWAAVEVTLRR